MPMKMPFTGKITSLSTVRSREEICSGAGAASCNNSRSLPNVCVATDLIMQLAPLHSTLLLRPKLQQYLNLDEIRLRIGLTREFRMRRFRLLTLLALN